MLFSYKAKICKFIPALQCLTLNYFIVTNEISYDYAFFIEKLKAKKSFLYIKKI